MPWAEGPEECVSDTHELDLAELKYFGPDCIDYGETLKNLESVNR